MGLFDTLGNLTKAALNVAFTPIEIVKDVATMGSTLTDEGEPYTMRRLRKAAEKLDDALD